MTRRQTKKRVMEILEMTDRAEIQRQILSFEPQSVINTLFTSLCATSEIVRWNGVFCFGIIVPMIAERDAESARIIMRRFLWSLNDESGGIGWGAPEAMAEIMVHNNLLANEYLHMLLSYLREDGPEMFADGNFLELPMLQRGLLWGVWRLCGARSELMIQNRVGEDMGVYLQSEDGNVRGLAILCLLTLQENSFKELVGKLKDDSNPVDIYKDGDKYSYSVGELARAYLGIKKNQNLLLLSSREFQAA